MAKLILPPLKDDSTVPQIAKNGEWSKTNNLIYGLLAESINVSDLDQQSEEFISIPDMWARPSVVADALYNSNLANHLTIKSEWRGLLALFGLMPYHGQTIETKIVNLDNLKVNPFQAAGRDIKSNFANVLSTIMPESKIASDQSWHEIALIKMNSKPIGLLTPNTIVCPSRYYANNIDKSISWFQAGKLIDPCKARDITSDHMNTMIHYLEKIKEGLTKTTVTDDEEAAGIMGAIDSYIADCKQKLNDLDQEQVDIQGFTLANVNLSLPQQSVYPLIAQIFKYDTAGSHSFDSCIPIRQELSDNFKGCILVDEDMPNILGIQASKIRIWDSLTLEGALTNKARLKEATKEINENGYLFINTKDLFTPKFSTLMESNVITEHPDLLDDQYLYPFNPIALTLFDPDLLSQNINIVKSGESYVVSLKIKIQNHNGTKKDYVIQKEYGKNDVIRKDEPTTNAIWPNFSHPNWNTYFLYNASASTSLFIRNTFDINTAKEKIDSFDDPRDQFNYCDKLKGEVVEFSERLGILESSVIQEIYLMKKPPEAIFYDALSEDARNYQPPSQRTPLGLALVPKVQKKILSNNEFRVGIDFGTTNSCVYYRENNDEPRPISFSDRIYSPFEVTKDTKDIIDYTLTEFIPKTNVDVPFLSLSRDRLSQNDPRQGDNLPIWSKFIYYANNILLGLDSILNPGDRPIKGDLKWSDSPQDILNVEVYMAQIALQALAESYGRSIDPKNIKWSYSYPEAFKPAKLRKYKSLFRKSLNKAINPLEDLEETITPSFRSESLASALYFSKKVPFTSTVITIDIGGHTSDISIFQDQKLLWRSSLELAGRHILIDFLINNIDLIKSLAMTNKEIEKAYTRIEKVFDLNHPNSERNAIEMLVNSDEFAKTFSDKYLVVSGTEAGKKLSIVAEIALSGMLFYISRVLHNLKSKGLYKNEHTNTVTVCLGGKASLLYKSIFEDQEDQTGIEELFSQAAGDLVPRDSINFQYTENPKHEVSHGLLIDPRGVADLDVDHANFDTPLGENVLVGSSEVESTLSVNELNPSEKWKVNDLKNVKEFCNLLRAKNNILVDIDPTEFKNVTDSVTGNLIDAQAEFKDYQTLDIDPNSQELRGESTTTEPPFVVGLREIILRINDNKNKKINVKNLQH